MQVDRLTAFQIPLCHNQGDSKRVNASEPRDPFQTIAGVSRIYSDKMAPVLVLQLLRYLLLLKPKKM
jgi:hypothetical protein